LSVPMYREPADPRVVRHGLQRCPACGMKVDSAGSADGKPGRAPRTGDFTLCFGCAEPAVYEVDALGRVAIRAPTSEERAECLTVNAAEVERLKAFIAARRRRLT
jgi:hypothetical protein